MRTLRPDALQSLVARACERMGALPQDGEHVAASLVRANLCGYDSHGVFRLRQYHDWWRQGLLKPAAQIPEVAEERGFTTRVDGHWAFGQVVARFAGQVAVRRAQAGGLAVVTARNSNHVGRLADVVELVRDAALIGLAAVNDSGAGQCVVPCHSAVGLDGRLRLVQAEGVPVARHD